jgi:23S rRNA (uracil1939-C5)-methyltransferase
MFDKVFHVNKCWLQPEPSNEIRNFIFRYASEHQLPFFDIRNQHGFLRTLTIRTSTNGEVMVIISFFREEKAARDSLLGELSERFPGITSLLYAINPKGNDTLTDLEIFVFKGKSYITEAMEGLSFRIGPKSFFQTNSRQALRMYAKVREFAALTGDETVYDLYTGTGTIAIFLARFCRKVIGIEYVREAVEDAWLNSGINRITNAEFHAGDIRHILNPRFLAEKGSPDVVVTDPPRSGMHEDVVKSILEAYPARIVYVSCNPATQARDISLLSHAYRIEKVQPVDMFPHTHHVENIVLLLKKEQLRTEGLQVVH